MSLLNQTNKKRFLLFALVIIHLKLSHCQNFEVENWHSVTVSSLTTRYLTTLLEFTEMFRIFQSTKICVV